MDQFLILLTMYTHHIWPSCLQGIGREYSGWKGQTNGSQGTMLIWMFISRFLFTFAMVRQRLYHTLEQKDAANRAKSKRSYESTWFVMMFSSVSTSSIFMSTISIILDERPQSIRDAVRNMLKLKKSKVFDPTSNFCHILFTKPATRSGWQRLPKTKPSTIQLIRWLTCTPPLLQADL